jgi:hypothetical protein
MPKVHSPNCIKLIITDANNCSASSCATVSAPSGINHTTTFNYSLYPNPASSTFTIQSEHFKGNFIRIYAIDGSLKLEQKISSDKEVISVSELPQGVYSYKISTVDPSSDSIKGTLLIVR